GVREIEMIFRALHVVAHGAAAELGARGELRLAERKPIAACGANLNDTARGSRAVQRCARRTLHHLDALDVEGVEVGGRLGQNDAVDDDQRRVALVDARRRPQLDADAVSWLRRWYDRYAGDLPLNR